jgi:hypothetical protein
MIGDGRSFTPITAHIGGSAADAAALARVGASS